MMKIESKFLISVEKQLFIDILFKFEAIIAFDEFEMGFLDSSIEPPIIIHTISHTS